MLILLPPSETKRRGVAACARPGRPGLSRAARAAGAGSRGARRAVDGCRGRGARPQARRDPARRHRRQRPRDDGAGHAGRGPLHRRPLRRAGCGIPRFHRPFVARQARPHPLGAARTRWARSTGSRRTGSARRRRCRGCRPFAACGPRRCRRRSTHPRRASCLICGPRPTWRSGRCRHPSPPLMCGSSRRARTARCGRSITSTSTRRARWCAGSRVERPRVASRARLRAVGGCRGPARAREPLRRDRALRVTRRAPPLERQRSVLSAVRCVFSAIAMRATTASMMKRSTTIARNVAMGHQDQRGDQQRDTGAGVERDQVDADPDPAHEPHQERRCRWR